MNKKLVKKLFLYLIDQLQDMNAPISTIRLVKLLYLIDLEYYGRKKETFTGIEWIKYYYGPYFLALPNIIASVGFDLERKEVHNERGRGFTFHTLEEQDISGITKDFATQGLIYRIIEKWGLEDLDNLLSFVYGTLQIKYASFNDVIDFAIPNWAKRLEIEFKLLDAASNWDQKILEQKMG